MAYPKLVSGQCEPILVHTGLQSHCTRGGVLYCTLWCLIPHKRVCGLKGDERRGSHTVVDGFGYILLSQAGPRTSIDE